MTATSSSLSELLYPGLKEVFGSHVMQWEPEYTKIFDDVTSNKSYENYQEMISFGAVPESAEGVSTTYDDPSQGYKSQLVNKKYTLGFKVTREMVDDDQYAEISKLSKALAQSVGDTIETLGANILNNGFSGGAAGADGEQLFSTAHKYGNGSTYSNRIATAADLSMTSYEQATIDIAALTDGRGKKIKVKPKRLIISPTFARVAKQILGSELTPESAYNAINPFKGDVEFVISHYVTDADAWFLRTSEEGLICQKRVLPEFTKENDFDTDIAKFKTYFRMLFSWYNPRSIYGSPGA